MTAAWQRSGRWLRHPLVIFLPLQTVLLFYNLSLLPVWGDEQFTLNVIARPWSEIPAVVRADIHPPLYYLLARLWTQLALPGSLLERTRALSVVWCLLSTALIYRLWVRRSSRAGQLWFLAFWTFSPALVLYARMARSYTLQVFCGCLLVYAALRFLDRPTDRRRLLWYCLAAALTLYVHYLPGVALVAAAALEYAWRRRSAPEAYPWKPLIAGWALIGLLYLPWIFTLAASLSRVATTDAYRLSGSYALDHAIRTVYWFVSFTFGESLPLWTIVAGVAVTPLIFRAFWRHRTGGAGSVVATFGRLPLVAAAIAYVGAAMWVAFPFTAARSLFLLPFYLLWLVDACLERSTTAHLLRGALLLIWAGALGSYLHQDSFLNKGYITPFEPMAASIREHSAPSSALVVIDGFNVDPKPLVAKVCEEYHCIVVSSTAAQREVRQAAESHRAKVVWYLRGTHDISPGEIHGALEAAFAGSYSAHRHLYLPYSRVERAVMRLLGWQDPPTHYYQMIQFVAR
jgi:Dolichyl-phosphate-mannose-protein mannosyltransferase